MMSDDTIFITSDGSHSILSEKYGVSYHSKHGAIQETQHVFIEAALHHQMSRLKKLNILEIGFGTGLNAYMTMLEAEQNQLQIEYTSVEAYPITSEQAQRLNYSKQLQRSEEAFLALHDCPWNEVVHLNPHFSLTKSLQSFEDIDFQNEFDIIYFDAFAPNAQPELWEEALLSKMYISLKKEGVLTTYCAKGLVKRLLKSIGFVVESIPGPPGKREMTRAIKQI